MNLEPLVVTNSGVANMSPYSLATKYAALTSTRLSKKTTILYCVLGKKIISHLKALNWKDNDISFYFTKVVDTFRMRGLPVTFPYIYGFLSKVNTTPHVQNIEKASIDAEMEAWIQAEIKRQQGC